VLEDCSAECAWVTSACVDACGDTARTTPWDAEDVCVPAGPFIRGSNTRSADSDPQSEVTLSSFYIDRYPVTYARYAACMDAGVCTLPSAAVEARLTDPATAAVPVQDVTADQARVFCEWVDRRLPTEAEWEKSARGPAPRTYLYAWGSDTPRCSLIPTRGCPGVTTPSDFMIADRVDAFPGTASYYGMDMVIGAQTWVSDRYGGEYYADLASLVDPRGPVTGDLRVARGMPRWFSRNAIPDRFFQLPESGSMRSIRCARDGWRTP